MPEQIAEIDRAQLEAAGLSLAPTALWNPAGDETNGGLMRAAVNLSGCSAAFISAEGLIATNHHCAYRALQARSSPEHDYLTEGFLARERSQELEATGATVRVLRRIEDVTDKVRAAATAAKDDRARRQAVERVEKELVAACEQGPGARCDVASFYGGSQYRLFEYVELRDVRLVYAPPAAVGEYGGEIDNWMWPRHTGDFSLLRAYVGPDGGPADHAAENRPYRPAQYLKVSPDGVSPGDFVAVLGYPGSTQRYMPAVEVERWVEQVLPGMVSMYGEWIDILEREAARGDEVRIKVAALQKGLANRHKNARGMLDGIAHMGLVERRRGEDTALREWAAAQADKGTYAGVLDELAKLSAQARERHERTQLLGMLRRGPNLLAAAVHLARRAHEHGKPDLERTDQYMDRNQDRLWKGIERHLRDFDPGVDAALLASLLARNAALPKGQRSAALAGVVGRGKAGKDKGSPEAFQAAAAALVEASTLSVEGRARTLWDQPAAIAADDDPLLALARALAAEIDALEAEEGAAEGAQERLLPAYFEMLRAVRKGPIYPDANGTLRFSYATVRGYDKWDGQTQSPQTKLGGAMAKHTGKDPFDLPKKIRDQALAAKHSRWADSALADVPLCFLSSGDTTGGNSGSPVIDGKGRLVGLNFDRVWENIAGDFAYDISHSRNVSVDVRYLLWMLDEVESADHLLAELGIEPAPATKASTAEPTAKPQTQPEKRSGCGCRAGAGEALSGLAGLVLVLLGLGRMRSAWRRRRTLRQSRRG